VRTSEVQRQAARAIVAMLCQRWPKCFDLKNRWPLKIHQVNYFQAAGVRPFDAFTPLGAYMLRGG
jgi:hypothetical protein